ncbi:hypothetical protein ABZ914_02115 [Spirillospora sp. NPDC046719]
MSPKPQQQKPPGEQPKMSPVPDCGEEFAREGADVLISYLDEHNDARDTARLVEEAGRRAVLVPGDLSEADHCRWAVPGSPPNSPPST